MKNLSVINDNLDIVTKEYVDDSIGAISIPTKTSDLTNDAGYITGITSSDVTTALGYTPYSSANPNGYTSNVGTITGITMNGVSKGTSGVVNLGTVLTSHQDISGKVDTLNTDSLYGSFRIDYGVYINQPSVYMQGTSSSGQIGKIYVETAEGDSSYVANVIEATDPNGTANAGITVYIHTDQDENVVGSIRLDASGAIKLGSDSNISIFSEESMDLIALNDDIHINSNSGNVYIQNLVTPTLDADAATKKYVDDSIPTIPTVPTITLNGSSTTSPSFYAPTTTGTSGYYLKSNGSGAPTWAQVYGAQIVRW